MRILVVDDDAGTRGIIRRVLANHLKCHVSEAVDGARALAALNGPDTFDAVVLDLQMPTMGGMETLAHIRRSPRHSALPVIVLTADAGEEAVREVAVLGIHAYLTKPINPARLATRFKGIVEQIARQNEPAGSQRVVPARFELDPDRPVLVADADWAFRAMLAGALADRVTVVQAENGFKALQALMVKSDRALPQMVLLGPDTGLLSGNLLVDKIRKLPIQNPPRVVGIYPPEQAAEASASGLFDAFVQRTPHPETLIAEFDALWGAPHGLRELLQRHPRFKADLAADVVAVMLARVRTDMTPLEHAEPVSAGPLVEGRVPLESEEPPLTLHLLVRANKELARKAIASVTGRHAGDVTDEEFETAVGGVVAALAGRVEHRLGEFGLTTRPKGAEICEVPVAPDPATVETDGLGLAFRGRDDPSLEVYVSLTEEA